MLSVAADCYDSFKVSQINRLLRMKGVKPDGRKAQKCKQIAIVCSANEVQEFRAQEDGRITKKRGPGQITIEESLKRARKEPKDETETEDETEDEEYEIKPTQDDSKDPWDYYSQTFLPKDSNSDIECEDDDRPCDEMLEPRCPDPYTGKKCGTCFSCRVTEHLM